MCNPEIQPLLVAARHAKIPPIEKPVSAELSDQEDLVVYGSKRILPSSSGLTVFFAQMYSLTRSRNRIPVS